MPSTRTTRRVPIPSTRYLAALTRRSGRPPRKRPAKPAACHAACSPPSHPRRTRPRAPPMRTRPPSRRPSGLRPRSHPRPRFGLRRNVPLRSLAAGAASARGGKKPPAGRSLACGEFLPSCLREGGPRRARLRRSSASLLNQQRDALRPPIFKSDPCSRGSFL